MSTDNRRSWFCVLNNPQKVFGEDLEPKEIVDKAIQKWMGDSPSRSCAINYEVGDTGTPHMHMVLEDSSKVRFSAIKKIFGDTIHVEPTRGNKQQAMAYIMKEPPFEEKAHTVIIPAVIVGQIQASARNDKISIYDEIDVYIQNGMTPKEIMRISSRHRKEESLIRKAYFAKRAEETPPRRAVNVIWHVGLSGSGKSETYVQLCEQYGEEHVYMLSDFKDGGLDMYCGEPILFIDELRETTYSVLLGMLEGIKKQIHCRYANALSLWTVVHITSIYPPEELYERMVPKDQRQRDSLEQLMRRISTIVLHYIEDGKFKSYEVSRENYIDYADLRKRVFQKSEIDKDGFQKVDEYEQSTLPFQE